MKINCKLKYCNEERYDTLRNKLAEITNSLNVKNVFNPSFYSDNNVEVISFRAIPHGNEELTSFVYVKNLNNEKIINISHEFYNELGRTRLIDPKVFRINNEIYVTFNSGHIPEGNDIYVMKIYPEQEKPKKIIYSNRNEQERNWGFFSENNEIYALYWLNPLKILKLKKETENTWEFEDYFIGEKDNEIPEDITLGTQPFFHKDKYYLMGHKKIINSNKKIYLGKFCKLDFNKKKVNIENKYIIHSFLSLFGSEIKHNKNLLSCTYFSGLQIIDNEVILGYGINDVDYGFSKYKLNEIK